MGISAEEGKVDWTLLQSKGTEYSLKYSSREAGSTQTLQNRWLRCSHLSYMSTVSQDPVFHLFYLQSNIKELWQTSGFRPINTDRAHLINWTTPNPGECILQQTLHLNFFLLTELFLHRLNNLILHSIIESSQHGREAVESCKLKYF